MVVRVKWSGVVTWRGKPTIYGWILRIQEVERLQAVLQPYLGETLSYVVSTRVTDPRNDSPDCITSLDGKRERTLL